MNNTKSKYAYIIRKKLEENEFPRFDRFLSKYLGFVWEETEDEEEQKKSAYQEFLHRTENDRPASLPTIRRWFGLRGYREPSREQIIRMAFPLGLSLSETEEFLMKGIREPAFQINDYTEAIAMYCLENHLGYAKYESMCKEYEMRQEMCGELCHEANTKKLYQQFQHTKHFCEADFMYWMWENIAIFKGYSKTTQEYLNKYRELILQFLQEDVKKRLHLLLAETGYETWRKKRRADTDEKESKLIRQYLDRSVKSGQNAISNELRENILECMRLVYSGKNTNTRLLSEVFSQEGNSPVSLEELPKHTLRRVTGKYLSDLFHIPERNELAFRVRQALSQIEQREKEEPVPAHVLRLIGQISRIPPAIDNVGEARDWLREFDREGKRRRLMVKRMDLLPMILYVAQQNYMAQTDHAEKNYNKKDALKMFCDMADATLIACSMVPLDRKYLPDMLLLECFQEDGMYGYENILELL